ALPIPADVVHVHAEPMARPVHEERTVPLLLDRGRTRPLDEPEVDEAVHDDVESRRVHLEHRRARTHAFDRRELRREYDLVDRALSRVEAFRDRERARYVRGVVSVLTPRI